VELRRRRAAAQGLAGAPAGDPAAAVARLLAVQAQDLRAARLALRARGGAREPAAVDAALADGALVLTWLLRGTLHLVACDDLPWLHALTGGLTAATTRRRIAQLGLDAKRAGAIVLRALADSGTLTRAELAGLLSERGIDASGQRLPHLLALLAARGAISLGPGKRVMPLRVPAGALDRAAALAELARRYLRAHGPATDADLAGWSGLPLRDARAGLAAIAAELERTGGLVDLAGRAPPPRRLPPRLLPAFDPYLLGWRDRSFAVLAAHARSVHPGGGMLRPVVLVGGAAAGTWTLRAGRAQLTPFAPPSARTAAALRREAAAVERFAGAEG
jgi:hypothetical protein